MRETPEQFKQYLYTFPNEKRVEVTVEKLTHSRTNQQNKYYWAVIAKTIAEHTGHDPEQIHELLKQIFSPKWYYNHGHNGTFVEQNGIPTSTTRLDTIALLITPRNAGCGRMNF